MQSKIISIPEQIRNGLTPYLHEIKAILRALGGPREFHTKHGFPLDQAMPPVSMEVAIQLTRVEGDLADVAVQAMDPDCLPLYRLHLIAEEAAELAKSLRAGDRVAAADALADLLYVVIGTAESYGLPWLELLEEVHRSNMTKQLRTADNIRMRDKGPDYRPPNISQVLDQYSTLEGNE